jgi:hypothetical protein
LDRVSCVIWIRMSGHSYPARRLCLQPLRRREVIKTGAPLSPQSRLESVSSASSTLLLSTLYYLFILREPVSF